uniref:EF-hand domain-containing protein n=2 Tax=Tetraselmis sp. GSL018 TaxID=582737 RepID=A0A061S7W3_9CHLO|mmetsp:Transcript_20873/g.49792  ORF Transcript_20873/g.49792 Transcript_20873/m.49792 type:complete len:175 (-) Transcript_20873:44-568(-)
MATKRTGSRYKKKEILELKKVFDSHDADGSGSVSVSELKQHLTTSALGSGDFVKTLDKDGDGHITFKEYLMAYYRGATAKEIKQMLEWTQPKEVQEEEEEDLSAEQIEELKAMFNLYDKNKNGTLDKCELVEAMKSAGYDSDEAEDMIEEYDEDGNCEFSLEEFINMLQDAFKS